MTHNTHPDPIRIRVEAPGASAKVYATTSRRVDVLRMLACDLRHKQIADRMGVSIHTVRTLRDDLFRDLGVRSSHGAVAVGMRIGLIT
jgi:DNA-binding NarL/FixJ family response regulator